MREFARVFIVVAILLLTFGLPVLLQSLSAPKTSKVAVETVAPTIAQVSLKFVSLAPTQAIEGGTYIYQPNISANAGESISLSVVDAPSWLSWKEDAYSLHGSVPKDINSFAVTLKAESSSGQSITQSFTVTVESPEESVKGASTTSSDDPFHPIINETKQSEPLVIVTEQEGIPDVLGASNLVPTQSVTVAQVLGEKTAVLNVPYIAIVSVLAILAAYLLQRLFSILFKKRMTVGGIVIERGRL